jgi:hypothetical protein
MGGIKKNGGIKNGTATQFLRDGIFIFILFFW